MPASPNEMRVAVVGVPRGGTSAVAGLCRILGYRLPEGNPDCVRSESRLHRLNPERPIPSELARRVDRLPAGTVWKDPSAGDYAGLVDWSTWTVIMVTRGDVAVATSEARWPDGARGPVWERNARWKAALCATTEPVLILSYDEVRDSPSLALANLNWFIGSTPFTSEQLQQAEEFINPGRGYRCPQPGECEVCK